MSTSVSSLSRVAPRTVTTASIVAAPALSMTAVRSRSTKRTGRLCGQRGQQVADAGRTVDDDVGGGAERLGRLLGLHADAHGRLEHALGDQRAQRIERVDVGEVVACVEGGRDARAVL